MIRIKQVFAKSFAGRLFQKSKILFVVITFFFAGTILSNVLLIPTTPFFVWDMFSSPVRNNDTISFYQVQYNDQVLPPGQAWKSAQSIILNNQLKYYSEYKQNDNQEFYARSLDDWTSRHFSLKWLTHVLPNSTQQFKAFPGWYKKYLSAVTGKKIYTVSFVKKTVSYSPDHSVHEISADTLVTIQ